MAKKKATKKPNKSKKKKGKGGGGKSSGGSVMVLRSVDIGSPTEGSTVDCADSNVLVTVTMSPPASTSGITWTLDLEHSFVKIGTTERPIQLFSKSGDVYSDSITNFMLNPGTHEMSSEAHWIGTTMEPDGPISFTCQASMMPARQAEVQSDKKAGKKKKKK